MDPRRFLIWVCAALAVSGCATVQDAGLKPAPALPPLAEASPSVSSPAPSFRFTAMAPIPNPPDPLPKRTAPDVRAQARPSVGAMAVTRRPSPPERGRPAIAAANLRARERSHSEAFVGGMQVFSYAPGRVYEVWTAPLRVTTLTLSPGEVIVSKAAGDTVRWQIGETTSGQGRAERAHVMIKPLERGLETNLVLATSQRIYLIQLKSSTPETFNAAISWDLGAVPPGPAAQDDPLDAATSPAVTLAGPLDARFRIDPRGRPPTWTPTAVMTDGVRTFLRFPPDLSAREAPVLLVRDEGGETQIVNYRQQAGLWVVDRVFDRAELRIGGRRPKVVRIVREGSLS